MNRLKIKEVNTLEEAKECNYLLTKLITDESNYDKNIKKDYTVKNYFEKLYKNKTNKLYIAIENNKIVGYIYVKIISSDNGPEINHEAFIDGLYVLNEYRNRKIATLLIRKAKEWSKEKGAKFISLNVLCKNKNAINLYIRENFEEFSLNLKTEL